MDAIQRLVARDESLSIGALTPTMMKLLIALLALVLCSLLLVAGLFVLRSYRKRKQEACLPLYNEKPPGRKSNHRRLTITTAPYGRRSESIYVYSEKQNLVDNSSSPPPSPIPEIRITFPEEENEAGKTQSGRVLVVRVGDTGVGLEPLMEENLPPYQRSDSERFQSIDLERVGGLREKDQR